MAPAPHLGPRRVAGRAWAPALLCAAALALAGSAAGETLERHWATGPQPLVRIHSDDARVRVRAAAPDSVGLVLKHVVKTEGWRYEAYGPQLSVTQSGDTIDVEARTGGGTVVMDNVDERFEIELGVPAATRLELATGDGSVDLSGVEGSAVIDTWGGRVSLRATGGDTRVRSRDGDVVATNVRGALDASTKRGRIAADGRFERLALGTGPGALDVKVLPGSAMAGEWSLSSDSGPLRLTLPRGFSGLVVARTTGGSLRCTLPLPMPLAPRAADVTVALGRATLPLRVRTGTGRLVLSAGR